MRSPYIRVECSRCGTCHEEDLTLRVDLRFPPGAITPIYQVALCEGCKLAFARWVTMGPQKAANGTT